MENRSLAIKACIFRLLVFFMGSGLVYAWAFGWSLAWAAESDRALPDHEDHGAVRFLSAIHGIISRVDGKECPMVPTCSRYGFDAINQYGFLRGWIMICDRLIRCGRDECRLAEKIIVDGKVRSYDPLPEKRKTD